MALTVRFENEIREDINRCVTSLAGLIDGAEINGVTEVIPTFNSLTVLYDCTVIHSSRLKKRLARLIDRIDPRVLHASFISPSATRSVSRPTWRMSAPTRG